MPRDFLYKHYNQKHHKIYICNGSSSSSSSYQPLSLHCRMKTSTCFFQYFLSLVCSVQAGVPQYSRHLLYGLPWLLFQVRGVHSVTAVVHLPSVLLATWPAHVHFPSFIVFRMSWNFCFFSDSFICLPISHGDTKHASLHIYLGCCKFIFHALGDQFCATPHETRESPWTGRSASFIEGGRRYSYKGVGKAVHQVHESNKKHGKKQTWQSF